MLDKPYGGVDPETLKITETNYHPNGRGHTFIAQSLLRALQNDPEILGIPLISLERAVSD